MIKNLIIIIENIHGDHKWSPFDHRDLFNFNKKLKFLMIVDIVVEHLLMISIKVHIPYYFSKIHIINNFDDIILINVSAEFPILKVNITYFFAL